jgi:hypothetical protein
MTPFKTMLRTAFTAVILSGSQLLDGGGLISAHARVKFLNPVRPLPLLEAGNCIPCCYSDIELMLGANYPRCFWLGTEALSFVHLAHDTSRAHE